MTLRKIVFGTLLFLTQYSLFGQLTFVVDQIPENTPDSSFIYVAGDFNGWDPGQQDYRLELNEQNQYWITFNPSPGTLQFKFTRGSWESVEGNENGGFLPNRSYQYAGSLDTAAFQILSWEDTGGINSTAAENVHILDDDFHLPLLDRERRIWIYLPPDYDSSVKRYKVLYMHDGQNLFDVSTSFAGEWEIDETLNRLFDDGDEGCIVVGIDNGGTHRLDEYSPWPHIIYGGGEGDAYLASLLTALIPYVDENYRTLADREHRGIMGSSMGGLISLYGGLKFDQVFSRVGVFSCSYWFAREEAFDFVENDPHELSMRIYSIAGALESGNIPEDAMSLDSLLQEIGYSTGEFTTTIHADGQHGEWYWAREFEDAYRWLWSGLTPVNEVAAKNEFRLYPNPTNDSLTIDYSGVDQIKTIYILDLNGRLIRRYDHYQSTIPFQDLPDQVIIRIELENGSVFSQTISHPR